MKQKTIFFFIFISLFEVGCSFKGQVLRHEFADGWKNSEIVELQFIQNESVLSNDLFFVLRHEKSYSFSNIFLISNLKLNGQKPIIDTTEFILSEPDGKWKGESRISNVEHILEFKKNVILNKDSLNTLTIRNSMRLNNQISPVENLKNILDIGLLIKPAK